MTTAMAAREATVSQALPPLKKPNAPPSLSTWEKAKNSASHSLFADVEEFADEGLGGLVEDDDGGGDGEEGGVAASVAQELRIGLGESHGCSDRTLPPARGDAVGWMLRRPTGPIRWRGSACPIPRPRLQRRRSANFSAAGRRRGTTGCRRVSGWCGSGRC